MRKWYSVLLVLAVLLLAGCQPEEVPVEADFSFEMPEGAAICNVTQKDCSIEMDGQVIGGIVLTDLRGKSIDRLEGDAVGRYLESWGPMPLMCEYISMFSEEGTGYYAVTLKVTDPATEEAVYTNHYLFERKGGYYDLWLEETVEDSLRKEFLIKAGILPE